MAMTLPAHAGKADNLPKMIAYSAQPNPYFDERASEVAKIYDGFFFVVGSWDEDVAAKLGLVSDARLTSDWKDRIRENVRNLRQAGATENLLGVHFSESAPWPSPETLLSKDYAEKFRRHFAAIGRAARELGFRGVSIDVEYPYQRYSLDHEIYTYKGYASDDLLAAASEQGEIAMSALLDEFPDAVVFVLPGDLWGRPIGRTFVLSMLKAMADRDAPGGFHLGYERAYCLLDPVSQVAVPRVGDCAATVLLDPKTLRYWKRRCTVAPGVWPLHMVETGGEGYPVRPWRDELTELRQQMQILRSVAKRYIWSFSGQPVWYLHTPELEQKYGLTKQAFEGADEAIPGWHRILAEKKKTSDPRIKKLISAVRSFDSGKRGCVELCSRLGTPAEWLVLGPLGNPFTHPQYSAPGAIFRPVRLDEPIHGRDGVVRWFVFRSREPTGSVSLRAAFDWRATDDCSAHLLSEISSPDRVRAYMWIGWDDGIAVWINNKMVFDHRTYPKRGHGMLFRDRYLFEERVPVVVPKGKSRLAVTSINSHGVWGFAIRFTDKDGFPLEGLTFSLPSAEGGAAD
jgi:hypothetical protein